MARAVRISLANKCQLLFGAALVLIVTTALAVVWLRMETLVREGSQFHARKAADAWIEQQLERDAPLPVPEVPVLEATANPDIPFTLIHRSHFDAVRRDLFLAECVDALESSPERTEFFAVERDVMHRTYHRYVRVIHPSDLAAPESDDPGTELSEPEFLLLVEFRPQGVKRQQVLNLIYVCTAGFVAMLLAIGVFWFITTRIILSPVRILRDTAEKIAEGDTNIRSDINTGDEYEQLSDMFNTMVGRLNANEAELRQSNKSLDLKLGELAEHNVALFEANKIKDDFLANVSHELRTPLHSIIGFAEVLEETLKPRTGPVDEKRKRYTANIIAASRRLLDLINDLLDLAKIEAGRIEIHVEPLSVADTCEGLINLIRPQAAQENIEIRVNVARDIPLVHTDPGKVQQIVFNFLSNAIKFTPSGGAITLSAAVVESTDERFRRLKISVSDTGPGIPTNMHEKIFDKFTQVDGTVTKQHGGTGLGLTICRDLAKLLQGEVEVQSEEGHGATFSLLIALELESRTVPLMPGLAEEEPT